MNANRDSIYVVFWMNSQRDPRNAMSHHPTAVASMRRTEALASVTFYQILSIFIFFIRLIILEDFIRLILYNGPCVRLGCSFFLATALHPYKNQCKKKERRKSKQGQTGCQLTSLFQRLSFFWQLVLEEILIS